MSSVSCYLLFSSLAQFFYLLFSWPVVLELESIFFFGVEIDFKSVFNISFFDFENDCKFYYLLIYLYDNNKNNSIYVTIKREENTNY